MGSMTYDGVSTRFDDRLLAHLQIVMVQSLRQHRSFLMSWLNALDLGDGRTSIWVHQNASIRFAFDGGRWPSIDKDWIDALTASAASPRGLIVMDEKGVPTRSGGKRVTPPGTRV
jgi:hypothetical protein